MTTKLPSRRDVRFLLAEDVRQEMHNKSSLLGLIPGEQFTIEGPPPAVLPPGSAFALPSLAFFFVITNGQGQFKGRFRVIAPDKKTAVVDVLADKPIELAAGRTAVFATAAKPFVGPAFGTYSVQLHLDKAKFAFPMAIGRGDSIPKSK